VEGEEGDEGPGDAEAALCDGAGETAGVAVAVPVTSAGRGTVGGTAGAEVSGWMGTGDVWGAFCTAVAMGLGVSCAGVAMGSGVSCAAGVTPGTAGSCDGDSGARSQPEIKAARNKRRTCFMMTPADRNILVFRGLRSNNNRAARLIIRIDPWSD
jgi:hypothetical protein